MFKIFVLLLALAAGAEAMRPGGFYRHAPPKASFCQGCRSIVSYLTTFNVTTHREQYKDVFKSFCELYYPASTDYQQGPCPFFVESLFKIIEHIDPVNHCDQVGACGPTPFEVPHLSPLIGLPERLGGQVCDVCQQVIEQVQALLESPKFIDDLHNQVDALCDYLKVIDQDKMCKQVLDKNLDQALDFVRSLKPRKYCQSVHLCDMNQEQPKHLLHSLANFNQFGIETSAEVSSNHMLRESRAPTHTPNCMLCKTLVKETFNFLRQNRTEENVRLALDKVCGLVYPHSPKRKDCEQMVDAYTRELIDLLTQETDPDLICILLEQCTYQPGQPEPAKEPVEVGEQITISEFISQLDPSIEQGSIKSCVECKLFIKYLQETLEANKSREETKHWLLTNLCASLEKDELRKSCVDLVNTYADVFFEVVAKEIDPEQTCFKVGACHHKQPKYFGSLHERSALKLGERSQKRDGDIFLEYKRNKCVHCAATITKIDEWLGEHGGSDPEPYTYVSEICNKMEDRTSSHECKLLVDYFGASLAERIAFMHNPMDLCQSHHFC